MIIWGSCPPTPSELRETSPPPRKLGSAQPGAQCLTLLQTGLTPAQPLHPHPTPTLPNTLLLWGAGDSAGFEPLSNRQFPPGGLSPPSSSWGDRVKALLLQLATEGSSPLVYPPQKKK